LEATGWEHIASKTHDLGKRRTLPAKDTTMHVQARPNAVLAMAVWPWQVLLLAISRLRLRHRLRLDSDSGSDSDFYNGTDGLICPRE